MHIHIEAVHGTKRELKTTLNTKSLDVVRAFVNDLREKGEHVTFKLSITFHEKEDMPL